MTRIKATANIAELGTIALAILVILMVTPDRSRAQSTFDHFATGFHLEGAHRSAECDACHADGMFAGTPTQCSGCHIQGSRVNATFKPPMHNSTTNRCDSCHRVTTWASVDRVDHLEVLGLCTSCHNGQRAPGKPFDHIQTNDNCDSCHRTTAWIPTVFGP